MIHNVTIPFSFDTSPIEEQVAQFGEDEAKKAIREAVMNGLLSVLPGKDRGYYRNPKPNNDKEIDWKRYVDERMDAWIDGHMEDIVDEAALLMAMRAGRNKKWREVLDELKAERDAE